MTFTGEQVNTYGSAPSRLFFMDAAMRGLPVDVLHVFVGRSATMPVKACSLVALVDAAGPDMDQAETVTLFNDLAVFAPSALIDAPITWQALDDHHVRGAFTNGAHTVTAELNFNDYYELVDFVSDDRLAASENGKSFTPKRWSTPCPVTAPLGVGTSPPTAKAAGTPQTPKATSATSNSTSTRSPTTPEHHAPAARGAALIVP